MDVETGRVTIDRYVCVHDAGVLINPKTVDGQIHGLAHLALEIDAEQLRPGLIDEAIGLAFDLDDVGVFRDGPERTISVRLRPVDRVVAPQFGKQPVLRLDAAVGLVIGDRIVHWSVEHLFSLLFSFARCARLSERSLSLLFRSIPRHPKCACLDETGDRVGRQT